MDGEDSNKVSQVEDLIKEVATEDSNRCSKTTVMKQTQLRVMKSTDVLDGRKTFTILEPMSLEYNPNARKWMEGLLPYFEIVNVSVDDKQKKYTMRCLICPEIQSKHITDKCASSFSRHLQRNHASEYKEYEMRKCNSSSNLSIDDFFQVEPYQRNDPRQKRFERDLLKFTITDVVPFSVVEGDGFQSLIHGFDKRLIIPRRSTLQCWVAAEYDKIREKILKELSDVSEGGLHFIIDIWTSQQGQSILGFKVQYIKDWKVKQLAVGFKHFPETHSSENIRSMVKNFLGKDLKVTVKQVGTVTADNAANMIGAFKPSGEAKGSDETESGTEENAETCRRIEKMMDEALRVLDFSDGDTELKLLSALESWTNSNLKRNACLAHLLQLVIKDALNKCKFMVCFSKKINEIVTFFNNSPKWAAKLKGMTNGLNLVKPVVTRWNSLYHAIQRILRVDEKASHIEKCKVNMVEAINKTLVDAKMALPRSSKVPSQIYDEEIEAATVAMELLEPFCDLTDKLQADGVTSSVVILGVINAVKGISDVQVQGDIAHFEDICLLKESLCQSIKARFAPLTKDVAKGSRGRKIVSHDVFHDDFYIVASILDNRIKTSCFDDLMTKGTILEGCVPGKSEAVAIFRRFYENEYQETSGSSLQLVTPTPTEPPKKKTKSMFARISELAKDSKIDVRVQDEVNDYLAAEMDTGEQAEKISPLLFWEKNQTKYPILIKMAIKFLSMPASSGAVERLFSVAAGLGKARNARLLPDTTEKILCCKYFFSK